MKRKVLGVLFTAMCLCAVPSAAYAEAQEAETTGISPSKRFFLWRYFPRAGRHEYYL